MKIHPIAELFPMLEGKEFDAFVADVKKNGQKFPVTMQGDVLLDGRNRAKACEKLGLALKCQDFEGGDVQEFIVSANLKRRHLNESQRGMIASKMANMNQGERTDLQPSPNSAKVSVSQSEAAELLNVSLTTLKEAKALTEESPELAKEVEAGKTTIHKAKSKLKKAKVAAKIAEMSKAAEALPADERYKVLTGSVSNLVNWVACDAIITDPPYPKEHLHLYGDLAQMAEKFLKPNGIVCVMTGQTWLHEVLDLMCPHLRYHWMGCFYMLPGKPTMIQDRSVVCQWKPLLFFTHKNADLRSVVPITDVFQGGFGGEKLLHEWQQNEEGMFNIVSRLCKPGMLVLDPFSGSGTTGVACLKHGCLYHGIELDESTAKASITRLSEVKA